MPTIDDQSELGPEWLSSDSRHSRLWQSLSAKLIIVLLSALVVSFALLGYATIRLHRIHLENNTLASAEHVSDMLKRSTYYSMLHNDRQGLHELISTVGKEPGIERIRIIDSQGTIDYSSDPHEIQRQVTLEAESCNGCHDRPEARTQLDHKQRFRIYRVGDARVLGIITPIENQTACSTAECHAHPASQKILGILDINLSLARADANLRESSQQMLIYVVAALLAMGCLIGLFVWRFVDVPVKHLMDGTKNLANGELGYQIEVASNDEIGELAESFNHMSLEVRKANEEITSWAQSLERRVEDKTHELTIANQQMVQVEKMTSLGKMAAIVAHEINNPLSGILTYSKLLRRWLDRVEIEPERRKEMYDCLHLIETESKRCGELVKNLLTFSRTSPLNIDQHNLNDILDRALKLVQHHLDNCSIQVQREFEEHLPLVQCDGAQIEQVFLVMIMNACEAMPRGGNLWLRTRSLPENHQVSVQIRDDGIGIPTEAMSRLFEPFFTTKEGGKGVGLGLAISKNIIERHRGAIEVESVPGQGTTFYLFIPVSALDAHEHVPAASTMAATR